MFLATFVTVLFLWQKEVALGKYLRNTDYNFGFSNLAGEHLTGLCMCGLQYVLSNPWKGRIMTELKNSFHKEV